MYFGLLPVIHRSGAYSSTSYSRGIRWLPSPEVCQMKTSVDTYMQCVTGDHSFMHGFFPISVQYLTHALERILFSSVVMVLAFGARSHWFESYPDHIFLPCNYFFVTDFVRKMGSSGIGY